jgi:hypothetical protein
MVSAERLRLDEADTGREDYGRGDNTWSYFSHKQARSRAYRWGEDGLAGVSNDRQQLCLALGFYLDATPTSSYLKMLYKNPRAEFPYADLIAVDAARGKSDSEYELLDTGIFDGNRYFDVVTESAGLFVDLGPWPSHLLALQ